jgi:CheY-like chemotaxis protein
MSLRVLLTDADTLLLSIYRAFLADERLEVRTAATAPDCLEQLRRWRPDVLVLDADLPRGSGLGVLALLREDPTLAPVPVLLLASASIEDVFLADCAVLLKPVAATVLADVIRGLAGCEGLTARERTSAV